MNRSERIRFFITEQCRKLDPTFRSCVYPTQILLGNTTLPMLEGSTLTFRVNSDKKISFRIRLVPDEDDDPMNIGIPLNQVESISLKDRTRKHPGQAIVFLLKKQAQTKLIQACPFLDESMASGRSGHISKYLTVVCGLDKQRKNKEKAIHCRVLTLANKFTFAFKTAKKIFMNDFPIMWNKSLDHQNERRVRTGIHHDRELMAEMDDDAWDWFMGFARLKWVFCPEEGPILVPIDPSTSFIIKRPAAAEKQMKQEQENTPSDALPEFFMEEEVMTTTQHTPGSPESCASDSASSCARST